LPVTDPQFRLSANLSPSGTQLFIQQEDRTGLVFDLKTSEVIDRYDFNSPTLFDPKMAAIEARANLSEEDFSDVYLRESNSTSLPGIKRDHPLVPKRPLSFIRSRYACD
jgi:hypothetical protein